MSVLRENRGYSLSGGSCSRGGNNVSVFHVKLTESAARAIGDFTGAAKGGAAHPTICFSGNDGRISIPCSEENDEVRIFTFGLNSVARDNPHGSFDCVQQLSSGRAERLSCLGVIQKKMTVNATDDSYDKARQSLTQAEEETRSRGAIVIKHGGRFQGKRVTVRPPAAALAKLTKPKHSSQSLLGSLQKGVLLSKLRKGAATEHGKGVADVQGKPLRERVSHLLALTPYSRPELILRLQKDGLTAADRDTLDSVLTQVGHLNVKGKAFILKDSLYKDLQKDWPGYTAGDTQLLKRILVRRLFQPQSLLAVPQAQVSPLRDTPNSSPAHKATPSLPDDYTDPLLSKKPRISHLSRRGSRQRSSLRARRHPDAPPAASADDGRRNSLDPRALLDSLAPPPAEVRQRTEPSDAAADSLHPSGDPPPPTGDPPPTTPPDLQRRRAKRKRSKHKEPQLKKKDGWRERKEKKQDDAPSSVSEDCTDLSESLEEAGLEVDYLSKYSEIVNLEQRLAYKQDFNQEYQEYRLLHAHIDGVTRQFMELDTQLKQLHHDSHKYQTVRNKIYQEYRKIKKSNPNYNLDKVRCEYLHNKLAHIKKTIARFDHQHLPEQNPSSN